MDMDEMQDQAIDAMLEAPNGEAYARGLMDKLAARLGYDNQCIAWSGYYDRRCRRRRESDDYYCSTHWREFSYGLIFDTEGTLRAEPSSFFRQALVAEKERRKRVDEEVADMNRKAREKVEERLSLVVKGELK